MTVLLHGGLLTAALVFITVSATMNALFLSSLGRTPVEVGLLAAVSIAPMSRRRRFLSCSRVFFCCAPGATRRRRQS